MSIPTRSPLRMAGAVVNSGFANTGELRYTRGGEVVDWRQSGVNADTLVFSGAGRLNSVTRLTIGPLTSGVGGVVFYDGAVATSGGPFAASGHKVLASLVQPMVLTSGSLATAFAVGFPVPADVPFLSGLIVAPLGSGTPAFNSVYTPETNQPIP